VKELVGLEEELEVIYPVHPSPNVKGPAHRILGGHPRIHLLEPLSYPDLLRGIEAAACVLTDSGGIQEEAPSFGTRVLVLRDVTERPEGIDSGLALQVGTDRDEIVRLARQVLSDRRAGRQRDASDNPYGKGHAAEQIAELVEGFLEQRSGGKG
jgi:UDP-N-acetylglucosamine 2-epimerase (non-hydrolysing)